jgi:tryptophan synthase alpha chain
MGRISQTFERLRQVHERALIPYVTAGDPDLETTRTLVREMVRYGGDIIEIGVPFSDPLADGPIIQRASQRALRAGTTVRRILQMVHELRPDIDAPLILMTYFNPIYRYGEAAFVRDALAAGVDGIIVPDLPPEEAPTLRDLTAGTPLDMIFLAAPTSTPARLALIAEASRGFIYYVSRLGTTGVRAQLSDDLREMLSQLRHTTAKPIAVGFGVSTPEHVRLVAEMADGVVVASAILQLLEDISDRHAKLAQVAEFVAALKSATRLVPVAPPPAAS